MYALVNTLRKIAAMASSMVAIAGCITYPRQISVDTHPTGADITIAYGKEHSKTIKGTTPITATLLLNQEDMCFADCVDYIITATYPNHLHEKKHLYSYYIEKNGSVFFAGLLGGAIGAAVAQNVDNPFGNGFVGKLAGDKTTELVGSTVGGIAGYVISGGEIEGAIAGAAGGSVANKNTSTVENIKNAAITGSGAANLFSGNMIVNEHIGNCSVDYELWGAERNANIILKKPYNVLIKLFPNTTEGQYERAKTNFANLPIISSNNYSERIQLLEQIINDNPNFFDAYIPLIDAYIKSKHNSEAISYANKLIELKPEIAEAYKLRGVAYKYLGRLDKSLNDLDMAVTLKPDYCDAFFERAILKYKDSNLLGAEHDLKWSCNLGCSGACDYKF